MKGVLRARARCPGATRREGGRIAAAPSSCVSSYSLIKPPFESGSRLAAFLHLNQYWLRLGNGIFFDFSKTPMTFAVIIAKVIGDMQ